jgi:hypothetical protein
MMRSLQREEIELLEPDICEFDESVTWAVSCWFSPDEVFQGMHVCTNENNDCIALYCSYAPKTEDLTLYVTYWGTNAQWVPKGACSADYEVEMDSTTEEMLRGAIQTELQENKELREDVKTLIYQG